MLTGVREVCGAEDLREDEVGVVRVCGTTLEVADGDAVVDGVVEAGDDIFFLSH